MLDYIDYKSNMQAIDIGFGTGFPLIEIAMRLGETSIVYGIDPWSEAIEKARRKIKSYGISNVKIIEGIAEAIPLDDNSIDLITSNNGINNVTDIKKVLEECSRITKKGGQFIQTMNLSKSMFEFYDELENSLSTLQMFDEIELMKQHIAHKRPAIENILSKIQALGFIVKDLVYDQFSYHFTNGTAMLNHYFIRLAFMDSWITLLPEKRVEEIFDMVEKRLNKHAELFGGIKLSIPYVMINAIKEK
jgi:ubiquinone/menaquinone biosynthesis C-methylase UbiE